MRVCQLEIDGSLPRPCLYYDMHRCLGPCVAGLTTHEAYAEAVERARLFLAGRIEPVLKSLKREMWEAAEATDYERAARLRDTLAEIESISQRRKLSSVGGEDVDVFGVCVSGGNAAVAVLVMRGGQVLDRRELFWEAVGDITPERLLSELLPQLYDRTTFIPKEIHLPVPIEGEEALLAWLSEKKDEKVYLRMPSRGPKAERLVLARHNAELAHRRRFRAGSADSPGASALEQHLGLDGPPRRIEGFDISHFQGGETVASMVVWEEGKMRKGEYRSFNIKSVDGVDDFRSIHEAVERRYRRILEEVGAMPDLILIDGGRGQLNAALHALTELGVEETRIVSLAKREEEVYVPEEPEPLALDARRPGLEAPAADPRRVPPLRRLPPQEAPERPHPEEPARRARRHRPAPQEAPDPDLRQPPGDQERGARGAAERAGNDGGAEGLRAAARAGGGGGRAVSRRSTPRDDSDARGRHTTRGDGSAGPSARSWTWSSGRPSSSRPRIAPGHDVLESRATKRGKLVRKVSRPRQTVVDG